ncbi:hypothetical protein F4825DRAFT_426942 [Nemania diffusa]|nr:hypothetical protein F4825DRAFT_426942 [Nemania diffusa]
MQRADAGDVTVWPKIDKENAGWAVCVRFACGLFGLGYIYIHVTYRGALMVLWVGVTGLLLSSYEF